MIKIQIKELVKKLNKEIEVYSKTLKFIINSDCPHSSISIAIRGDKYIMPQIAAHTTQALRDLIYKVLGEEGLESRLEWSSDSSTFWVPDYR